MSKITILISMVNITFALPYAVRYLASQCGLRSSIFSSITSVLIRLSRGLNFFVYYFFNPKFKYTLNKKIRCRPILKEDEEYSTVRQVHATEDRYKLRQNLPSYYILSVSENILYESSHDSATSTRSEILVRI